MQPPVIHLAGSHRQMGYQHGRQTRARRSLIRQAMERRLAALAAQGDDFEPAVREVEAVWALEEVARPTLDMLHGMAEGLNLPFEVLLRYALASYLEDTRRLAHGEGCTVWAVTAPDQVLLAKNRDYRPDHIPLQCVAQAVPATGYRYTYVTSAGSPAVFSSGLNEKGLAVADTHVASLDIGPGLPRYSLMMHLLEEHDAVPSALDYLRTTARMGGGNLVLADAAGRLAVFEAGHRACAIVVPAPGEPFVVATNHFVSPALRGAFVETSPPPLRDNSFHRYARVREALRAATGHVDVPWAQRLLARHDGRLASICRHGNLNSASRTISAAIVLPRLANLLFCPGRPCRGSYRLFEVQERKLHFFYNLTTLF